MRFKDKNVLGIGASNDCNPNPCQNGGNCRIEDGHFKCECSPGYSGKTCEISNKYIMFFFSKLF